MAGNCDSCGAARTSPQARNCTQCGAVWPVALGVGSLVAGQYRIVQIIGAGGSGQIYLAEDTRTFNRQCVLKRTLLAGDAAAQARFATEAQTLTKLRHPQVPQIYAFFSDTDSAYIVMEYIAGRDLEQGLSHRAADGSLLPGQPRAAAQVLHDGITVCSILEHLHSRRPAVIHCDIKPANLIRDRESNALFLVDFGAAAIAGAGENFGTPGYAPPEQYRGQRSAASDIYALGATLYHLLTDDDPTEHPLKFPKLGLLPVVLRSIVERALATDPKQRPSASQLRQELERCTTLALAKPTFAPPNGSIPETAAEFVAAARANWGYSVDALVEGEVERWLREHHLQREAIAVNQLRPKTTPDLVLEQLLHWLVPTLPPTEIRLSQRSVEFIPTVDDYIPLHVTARGGMVRIKVVDAPPWLQVGPPDLILRPEATAAFNLALDPDRLPTRNAQESLVLEADLGTKKERITIPVSIGSSAHPVNARSTRKRPISIATLLGGWLFIIITGLFMAAIFRGSETITVHLGIGAMVGLAMTWLLADDLTDAIILTGGGALGGIGGGTILAALLLGGTSEAGFILAFCVAVVCCSAYQLLKSS